MSWQTHDRNTDHHGTEPAEVMVLSEQIPYLYTYPDEVPVYAYADELLPYSYGDEGDTVAEVLSNIATIIGPSVPSLGLLPRYDAPPHVGLEEEGESYYDLTDHKSYTWDGTEWQAWW